jgi:hypothetical protein
MAAQAPKAPVNREAREPKRGIKNPLIYAGTIIVLVIVIIAFVFLPVGTGVSVGGRSISFGQYAGKSIDYGQGTFMAEQVRSLDSLMRQQGLNSSNYQMYDYQLYLWAFERAVIRMGILDEAREAGARVTEDWLDEAMRQQDAFQENGVFSHELYQKTSLATKLSMRNNLRDGQLYEDYLKEVNALRPSSKEMRFVKEMAREQRSIEYVAYPLSLYPDTEVAAWGKSNAQLFRVLTLSRVTIESSEADALKLLKNIQSGKTTFEDVAKASSKDADAQKGGSMGAKYFHEISSSLAVKTDAESLAALKQGELSTVFKTSAGAWSFYRADAAAADADFSKPEVLANVREYMNRSERGVIEDWVIAKAKEISSAGGAAFKTAAKKAGLEVKSAGPFPINYGELSVYLQEYNQNIPLFKTFEGNDIPELDGASTSEQFFSTVFSLKPEALSEPIVLGDNVLVIKLKAEVSAKDEDLAGLEYMYGRLYQNQPTKQIRDRFMKSPKLKNEFFNVFFKYFYSKSEPAKAS